MNASAPAVFYRLSPGRAGAADIGLWVFMVTASMLFTLFLAAYLMRMAARDWSPIALPWQVWLSSVLLVAGSLALGKAAGAAHAFRLRHALRLFAVGGLFALAFLVSQLWAWEALAAMRVLPAGNPAGSFFFLLTAMHGLHVAGGLTAWIVAWRFARRTGNPVQAAWRIALCARYWHFLLAVWVALLAAMTLLTPELARIICGTQ
jgi:cytochrome c oxidase subunit 3